MANGNFYNKIEGYIDPAVTFLGGALGGVPGMALGFGLGATGEIGRQTVTEGLRTRQDIEQQTEALRQRFGERPLYEIPEETRPMVALYGETAGQMRDVSQQALEAAEARTGVQEAPGMAIAREQARSAAAGQRQAMIEAGGGSASTLGAVAKTGQTEQQALRDLAIQNQQNRAQAEQQYLSQLGSHAGVLGQATGLEGQGLGAMAAERGGVYERELGRYQDLTQFDVTQLGNVWAEEEARKNRVAGIFSDVLGAAGSIGTAFAGA